MEVTAPRTSRLAAQQRFLEKLLVVWVSWLKVQFPLSNSALLRVLLMNPDYTEHMSRCHQLLAVRNIRTIQFGDYYTPYYVERIKSL